MSNASNSTPSYVCPFNDEKRLTYIIMYVITLALGVVGNVLVLVIVAGRRTKRTDNDLFIANLALSDLSLLLFFLPWRLLAVLTCDLRVPFAAYCTLIYPMTTLTFSTSIFTMTAMSVHRCRHIVNPFMAPSRKLYTYIWIMLIWIFSISLILPLMILIKLDPKVQLCTNPFTNKKMEKTYTGTMFVLQCMIPLCIIACAYFLIWRDLVKSKTYRASVNKQGRIVANAASQENKQIAKTIATVVVLFIICTFPTQIAWFVYDFGGIKAKKIAKIIFEFSDVLGVFNSCLNPIVYGSLTKQFRRGYYRYLCFVCQRCTRRFRSNDNEFTTSGISRRDATNLSLLDSAEGSNQKSASKTRKTSETLTDAVSA